MSAEKILTDLKKKNFKPIYWLEGEEPFFIDEIINYAEHNILSESEASFNLSVFYGKDADWAAIVNACRRYPMFSERQVVLLKEAQHMRDTDLEKLEAYIENPLASTIFFVSYKDKKLDARKKFTKTVKAKCELLSTKKMYDSQLPEWVNGMVIQHGLTINHKAVAMLVDNIGNDLSRIKNEVEKLSVNLGNRKTITEDDIENFIGVSKEYNVFELQNAIAAKNIAKAIKIIQYFEKNPKAVPIQLVLPALYGFFSKTYTVFSVNSNDDRTVAAALGINPFVIKDYMAAAKNYQFNGIEKALLLLHQYNLRSVGIKDSNTPDAELLKELLMKIVA
ncbi:MAG: DNA polymerase III subunit delta [Chitinophagaceae bacterium]